MTKQVSYGGLMPFLLPSYRHLPPSARNVLLENHQSTNSSDLLALGTEQAVTCHSYTTLNSWGKTVIK